MPVRASLVLALALASAPRAAGGAEAGAAPIAATAEAAGFAPRAEPPADPPRAPLCSGEYADDLSALSPAARAHDDAQPRYTYCIRTAAVYECPYYASDGSLRKTRRTVTAHGTGFGYRRDGGDTLVVTNEHVAEWPAVTDEEHAFEDVPPGCRRVSESVKIVDDESDAYERDDVALGRVVADPQLDVAVLRAKGSLPVLPWRVGRSAALRERNAVDVRGFPLGVLRTTTVGKVTSAWQHDAEREWDHDDFVVDALLSPGNSGSPVLAVSCRTGEPELVGVYHAGYTRGSAINVVVGIDQVRELLDTLKRRPRPREDAADALDPAARERVAAALEGGPASFFPFGATVAAARARADGALVFQVMGREFPVRPEPALVLEDLPAPPAEGFGRLGRVWAGDGQGLRAVDRAGLDADAQAQLARLLDALRRDAALATGYQAAAREGAGSRERFDAVARLERGVRRLASTRRELAQAALDLADRLAPADGEALGSVAEALAVPPPAPPPAAPPPARPAGPPADAAPPPAAARVVEVKAAAP